MSDTVDEAIKDVVEDAVPDADNGGDTEIVVVVDEGSDENPTEAVSDSLELAEQVREIAADEAADAAAAAVDVAAAMTLSYDEVRAIARQEAEACVGEFAAQLQASAEDNGAPVVEEIVEDATAPENDEPPRTQSRWYRKFGS